jgi:hypothetical protein
MLVFGRLLDSLAIEGSAISWGSLSPPSRHYKQTGVVCSAPKSSPAPIGKGLCGTASFRDVVMLGNRKCPIITGNCKGEALGKFLPASFLWQ